MAGATVATWVKVKTKSGVTARPISHKYENGASYAPGQVITQSEYEEIKANRSEKTPTMAGKLAENVRTVAAEVVDTMPTGERKSRFSKLIDDMDELNQQDLKNSAQLLGITAKLAAMTEKYTGLKPREIATQAALPPANKPERKGGSRFENLISDFEDTHKASNKNDAKLLGAAASLYDTMDKISKNQTPKKLSPNSDRPALKPSKKPKK